MSPALEQCLEVEHPRMVSAIETFCEQLSGGVMRIGDQMRHMIEVTEGQLDQLRQLAMHSGANGIVTRIDAQRASLSQRVAELEDVLRRQDEAVRRALALCAQIDSAASGVTDLSLAADLLALSARTEMTRLGDEHKDLASVADQLAVLNLQVTRTAQRIRAEASALEQSLRTMLRRTLRLRQQATQFLAAMSDSQQRLEETLGAFDAQISRALAQGESGMGEVLTESQEALSHLAFEDVAIQHLQRIDALTAQLRNDLAETMGLAGGHEPIRYGFLLSQLVSEDDAEEEDFEAGDMMFF